jgi:nucleoside-diphosphate-sugar epimerase
VENVVVKDAARFNGRRVLITGGGGFIGRRLATALVASGAEVSIVDAPTTDLTPLQNRFPHIHCYPLDIRDEAAVRQAFSSSQPEYVFHLAAAGVTDPFLPLELALAVNLRGTINVLRASFEEAFSPQTGSTRERVVRLVHTGTPYERGGSTGQEPDPISPYAASKAAAYAIVRMFHRTKGWSIVTVRPFQVYGPGQPERALIPAAIMAAQTRQPFRMTGGEQRRDFVYVDDIVHGYLLAATNGVDSHSYDLGWGQTHSLQTVVNRLYTMMQAKTQPVFGAIPYRPGEIWKLQADVHATVQELGWSPQTTLEKGLALTVESFLLDNPTLKL